MIMKPRTTEKAVKMLDIDNTLLFEVPKESNKAMIKEEVEKLFNVKVKDVRTHIQLNKKLAYVRLHKTSSAADVATKLGMI